MNKNILAGILGVFLALSVGGNTYLYNRKSRNDKAMSDLGSAIKLKDSIEKELTRLEDSIRPLLSSYQEENSRLTGRIDELENGQNTQIQSLQNKIAYYKSLASKVGNEIVETAGTGKISKADAGKLASLKKELEDKIKEIEKLNSQIALLTSQRDAFEAQVQAEKDGKVDLEKENADLKDRVSKGAIPQYGTLLTSGIVKKGTEQIETYKSKGIEKLKITFDVLDNPLIREPVEEEVTIRIIGPEGQVLSTNNATLADKSSVYTLKQTIISDGEMHKVKWYFPSSGNISSKLPKGKYTTELWSRGMMKQKNTFELN